MFAIVGVQVRSDSETLSCHKLVFSSSREDFTAVRTHQRTLLMNASKQTIVIPPCSGCRAYVSWNSDGRPVNECAQENSLTNTVVHVDAAKAFL